ncbi:MAG: DUF5916 domain-containing protein [Fidelibacterota bacterium]
MIIRVILIFIIGSTMLLSGDKETNDDAPVLHISKINSPVNIDGILDEPVWTDAASSDVFYEVMPGENISPSVLTEVRTMYDDKQLYIAFYAYDDPDDIRATISPRDKIWQDDFVGIMIDTYGEATSAVICFVNPLGIQADGIKVGNNEDKSYDIIFHSTGRIAEDGYVVEMAIPFSSLRFPEKENHAWRFTAFRTLPRSDTRRQFSWTKIDRNNPCQLCQLGYLTGIEGIKSKRSIEWLPSIVGTQTGTLKENQQFINENVNSDIAIGLKLPIGSATTLELTVNPDFSQVEADVSQFDVNSPFALYFPEKRPFFNEGSDLFRTGGNGWMPSIRAIYTRTINDPKYAAKLLGRAWGIDYGIISAMDENTGIIIPFKDWSALADVGKSVVNIARLKYTMNNSSYVGGVLSDKVYQDGRGTLVGFDGQYYINNNLSLTWQAFASGTIEPKDTIVSSDAGINGMKFGDPSLTSDFDGETFQGHQLFIMLDRSGRNWGYSTLYSERTPTFRLDNGFIQRNHIRQLNGNIMHNIYPNNFWVQNMHFIFAAGRDWYYNWDMRGNWVFMAVGGQFAGQTNINLNFSPSNEVYQDSLFNGIYQFSFRIHTRFSERYSFGFNGSVNRAIIRYLDIPEIGFVNSWGAFTRIKWTDQIGTRLSYSGNVATYLDNPDHYYKGNRWYIKFSYQFNRYFSVRMIGEHFYQKDFVFGDIVKSFNLQPLITYQPNPFTIFYLGSDHIYDEGPHGYQSLDLIQNNRQIFLKFQYLFQSSL